MIKVIYDPEVDVLHLELTNEPIEESDEVRPGVIADYNVHGNVVAVEVMPDSTDERN